MTNKKARIGGLTILLLFALLLPGMVFSKDAASPGSTHTTDNPTIELHKIVTLDGLEDFKNYDKNKNKVADSMEDDDYLSDSEVKFFTIAFDRKPQTGDIDLILQMGGSVTYEFSMIYALTVRLPANKVVEYTQRNPHVTIISDPRTTRSLQVYRTARIIRVRPTVWDTYGYNGSGEVVTIMDSGINVSHADLQGKLKNWIDCDPWSCETSRILHDKVGHGTSIAGIIAGSGSRAGGATGVATVNMTFNDRFIDEGISRLGGYFAVDTDETSRTVNATLNWEANDGLDNYTMDINDSNNNGIGNAISDIDPLNMNTSAFTESDETQYSFSIMAEFDNPHDSTDEAYHARVSTPIESIGDGHNLLTGLAYGSEFVSVKVVPDDGGVAHIWTMNNAYDWVGDYSETDGVKVVSISLGDPDPDPIESKVLNNTIDVGVLPVISAGNGDTIIFYPARYARVLSVGAIDSNGIRAHYSNYGNASEGAEKWPDVLAPGGLAVKNSSGYSILTPDTNDGECVRQSPGGLCEDFAEEYFDDYIYVYGTSYAAPHVSALAALIAQAKGTWTYNSSGDPLWVKMIILMTAWENSTTKDRGGKDIYEGYGIVAGDAAIEAVIFNHTIGSTENATFGSDLMDKKVWARGVDLEADKNYTFNLLVPEGADYDLYLYNSTPDQYGQPQIVNNSNSSSTGNFENFTYTPDANGSYYLVAKWVSGNGEFKLQTGIPLTYGWNFISFLALPSNKTVENVLSPIDAYWNKINCFNTTTREWESNDRRIDNSYPQVLKSIEFGEGCWLLVNGTANLILYGNHPTTDTKVNLTAGWNYMGWPAAEENVTTALSDINGSYKVQEYRRANQQWYTYDSRIDAGYNQTLLTMKPGYGYGIVVESAQTLTIN